jgi:hypothetical protein
MTGPSHREVHRHVRPPHPPLTFSLTLLNPRDVRRYAFSLPQPAWSNDDLGCAGPWFSTQLALSLSIGLTSFFLFCFLRTRWEVVYMGRTKLKSMSTVLTLHPPTSNYSDEDMD